MKLDRILMSLLYYSKETTQLSPVSYRDGSSYKHLPSQARYMEFKFPQLMDTCNHSSEGSDTF